MKLLIGLGNPGEVYKNNRHNVGYLLIDSLIDCKLPAGFVLKKTDDFMNNSGVFVGKMVHKYNLNLNDLYILHDDLDIKIGEFKIQFGRGPKDHNGLKSVDQELSTDQYWHVRIGVDNRPLDNRTMGEEYVLQDFTNDERKILDNVFKEICKKLGM